MAVLSRPLPTTAQTDVELIVHANHWDPFSVLGIHEVAAGPSGRKQQLIRAFLPEAESAWVVDISQGEPGQLVAMDRIHEDGFFVAEFPGRGGAFPYRIRVQDHQGHSWD